MTENIEINKRVDQIDNDINKLNEFLAVHNLNIDKINFKIISLKQEIGRELDTEEKEFLRTYRPSKNKYILSVIGEF